jgi:hypothetical protein
MRCSSTRLGLAGEASERACRPVLKQRASDKGSAARTWAGILRKGARSETALVPKNFGLQVWAIELLAGAGPA